MHSTSAHLASKPSSGRPTIRGKRFTAQTILELLAAGESREETLRQYPSLEPEDIDACVAFSGCSSQV
ncbi:MAG TPA: DUF433 domain-containing protein [Thermoanaerobaculia bacterium]|nr:DUF433 domain-containing protein [Thermoanaerobaculia bacterium]